MFDIAMGILCSYLFMGNELRKAQDYESRQI
jgi:hypothetical protein